MVDELRYRLRRVFASRVSLALTNGLVIASVVLLFVLRLAPLSLRWRAALEVADGVFLAVFAVEFALRLFASGRTYLLRDFGWVDLLAVLPILAPLFALTGQFRALRIARLIRLVRIIRVVRLLRAVGSAESEHLEMRARFFLAISSIAMLFLLLTAVVITAIVDQSLQRLGISASELLDQIELVIMSSAVLAALGITAVANHFLATLVTDRIGKVNDYLESILSGGNKLPMRPDELGDEITELQARVGRVTSVFVV